MSVTGVHQYGAGGSMTVQIAIAWFAWWNKGYLRWLRVEEVDVSKSRGQAAGEVAT